MASTDQSHQHHHVSGKFYFPSDSPPCRLSSRREGGARGGFFSAASALYQTAPFTLHKPIKRIIHAEIFSYKGRTQVFATMLATLGVLPFLLSGCAFVAMEAASQGVLKARDEAAAVAALSQLKDEHPYIDFNQQFPETYAFHKSKSGIWKCILRNLEQREEVVQSKDYSSGTIVTKAKKIPLNEEGDDSALGSKRLFYEQEIKVAAAGGGTTNVTNKVWCFKSDKYGINRSEISLSDPENIIRGVFFGSLAKIYYPRLAQKAMTYDETGSDSSPSGHTVYVVQSGDTLGKIAKECTGSAMNYKEIAEYNDIEDPSAIRVGQEILIPK
jgi:nucleoid-associated protein YgaU